MCGICGIIEFGDQTGPDKRRAAVRRMNDALIHRGPDGAGELHEGKATLAMRRLAIIDLAGGGQPIWNEDRSVGVVMNGEIYNYRTLRAKLEESGHHFSTDSDTEVLVHLYEQYGDSFLDQLRGMFAFCLYDLRRERFLLGRDRFGEKPLYYRANTKQFIFSSEMGSLLEAVPERVLDHEALEYYLAVGYVPEPLTLIQNVKTLPPGHLLSISGDEINIAPYFSVDYACSGAGRLITDPREAEELLEPLLRKAVRRQLISDVPVGAFLSGGIDSSSICALASEELSGKLKTFTVRFEEAGYDESTIAAKVAAHLGSDHHEITVPNAEFTEEMFYEILDHVGLPFPDSSAIPVYLISKETRKHVKVALSGDGGDEVFGGYNDFDWFRKLAPFTKLPALLRKVAYNVANKVAMPLPAPRSRQLIRGLRAATWGRSGLSFGIHRMQFEEEVSELIGSDFKRTYPLQTQSPANFSTWSPLRQAMYYRLIHKLPTDMLIKVDRMSMANSLEVRAPLLDPDVFDASLRLADNLLFQGVGKGKIMLRRMMKDRLPAEVFDHPKQGFSIPLHKYQNKTYRRLTRELLGPGGPLSGLLEQAALDRATAVVFQGQFNHGRTTAARASHKHWQLLLLAGWIKRFDVQIKEST
ncbi:asparagine synthase (glutamine-hydrolyzing) [Lewinellaceae bacterium SD302]|nr:asparagine synthase (glutamine-hydrolyzing) [Lewinellaceae bacterium SD302]